MECLRLIIVILKNIHVFFGLVMRISLNESIAYYITTVIGLEAAELIHVSNNIDNKSLDELYNK